MRSISEANQSSFTHHINTTLPETHRYLNWRCISPFPQLISVLSRCYPRAHHSLSVWNLSLAAENLIVVKARNLLLLFINLLTGLRTSTLTTSYPPTHHLLPSSPVPLVSRYDTNGEDSCNNGRPRWLLFPSDGGRP